MKKLFKTLPVVCGLLALASCSENDMPQGLTAEQAAKNYDGLIVTVEELQGDDDATMRAAFAEGTVVETGATSRVVIWQKNDKIKLYGKHNWRTQLYVYDADANADFTQQESIQPFAAFTLDEASREKEDDYTQGDGAGYAVYPATAENKFLDEERQQFQYRLESEINYSKEYVDNVPGQKYNLKEATIYSSNIPMWGIPTEQEGQASKVTFYYLTGFLRVNMVGLDVKADQPSVITVTANKRINGLFTTKEFAYDAYDETSIPELVADDNEEGLTDEDKKITVNIPAGTKGDCAVYIPIPVGNYTSLTVELDGVELAYDMTKKTNAESITLNDAESTATEVKTEDIKSIKIERQKFLTLQYAAAVDATEDVTTLQDIADAIALYGTKKPNRAYNVKLTSENDLEVGNSVDNKEIWYEINYSNSELTNDVNLLLDFGFVNKNEAPSVEDKLQIIGGNNTKTLGIEILQPETSDPVQEEQEGPSCKVPVEVTTSGNVVLSGKFEKTVTIKAKDVILKGKFADVVIENAEAVNLSGVTEIGDVVVKASTSFTAPEVTLNDVDVTTTGAVTLGGATGIVKVAGAQSLTLTGEYAKAITANVSGDAKIAGTYAEVLNITAENVTVTGTTKLTANKEKGDNKLSANDKILVSGEITAGDGTNAVNLYLSAQTTEINSKVYCSGRLTLPADKANATATIAENVTCSGTMTTYVDLTINGTKANGLTIKDGATVTVAATGKIAKVNALEKGANLVIEGVITVTDAIQTDGGGITVNNKDFNGSISVNEDAEIDVQAGHVATITVAKDKTATITTSGSATIGEITGEGKYKLTATWDDNTVAKDVNDGRIYTAAQLAALQTETSVTNFNLYADVVATGIDWTSSKALTNGGTFNGNTHKITGLNIVSGTGNNAGFFKSIATGEATVENLTLENITVDGKRNGNSLTDGIGGLVGRLAGKLTVKKVSLSGKVEADNSMNIGGLVGTNVGTLNIESSKVDLTKISGKARMGGLVGVVGNNATVDVKKSEVGIKTISLVGEPNDDVTTSGAQAATIGMYVGMLQQATSALTVDTETKITEGSYNIKDNLDKLGFNKVTTVRFVTATFTYVGQSDGNFVGFSPLYTAGKAKIGDTTYTTNEESTDCLNFYVQKQN